MLAAQDSKEVLELLQVDAKTCYRLRNYPCALEKFDTAYAIQPSPSLRYNIASTLDKLGASAAALEQYASFEIESAATIPPDIATVLEERKAALLPKVAKVAFVVTPATAWWTASPMLLQSKAAKPLPNAQRYLEPGQYTVVFQAVGYLPQTLNIKVEAGKAVDNEVVLVAKPASSETLTKAPATNAPASATSATPPTAGIASVTTAPPEATQIRKAPSSSGSSGRTWGYVGLGVGIAAALGAATFYVVGGNLGSTNYDKYQDALTNVERFAYEDKINTARTLINVGHISAAIAVAGFTVAVLKLTEHYETPPSTTGLVLTKKHRLFVDANLRGHQNEVLLKGQF